MGSFAKSRQGKGAAFVLLVLLVGFVAVSLRPSMRDWPTLDTSDGAGLQVRFFGTSSLTFVDNGDAVVVDGFVTRPSLEALLFSSVQSDEASVRRILSQAGIEKVAAVMVAHSHFDHAMDAPAVARQFGAEVWGSASTGLITRAEGIGRFRAIASGDRLEVASFTVRVFETDHAPGGRMMGEVARDFAVPARAGDYRFGGGYGFHLTRGECRIMVVPSAGLPHDDLRQYPADVIFLSIGQLGLQDRDYIRRYYEATVRDSGARLVVPIHWDDFTRPLEKPLKPLPYVVERVDVAMREITALAGEGIIVALPVPYEPLDLSASGRC